MARKTIEALIEEKIRVQEDLAKITEELDNLQKAEVALKAKLTEECLIKALKHNIIPEDLLTEFRQRYLRKKSDRELFNLPTTTQRPFKED